MQRSVCDGPASDACSVSERDTFFAACRQETRALSLGRPAFNVSNIACQGPG